MNWKEAAMASAVIALGFAGSASATTIVFNDFSNIAGLQLNGNAAQAGDVLRVAPSVAAQRGSVFSTTPVSLASNVSFSTYFQFRISNPGGASDSDGQGADGVVFVVQTVSNTAGSSGGGIGYLGIPHSVGIEFDTWDNCARSVCPAGEPNGNHVGIDLGGAVFSVATATEPTRFNNGSAWNAWVDYDGVNQALEVRWSLGDMRPVLAQLTQDVNLAGELGMTSAFVGFTSATGAAFGDHDILRWEFRDTFNPVGDAEPGPASVSEPASYALAGIALVMLAFRRRRRGASYL